MKALLFSMPDIYPEWFPFDVQSPNLGLASLAGNAPEHDVYVGDLILQRNRVKEAIQEALNQYAPQIVGLSAMTFQFPTLVKIARFIKQLDLSMPIVIGGYHATILYEQIAREEAGTLIDFMLRGEADLAFNKLLDALESRQSVEDIKGLSYRSHEGWIHKPPRENEQIEQIQLPARDSRIWKGYHFFNQPFDVIETSRGCLNHCKFCSIKQFYGHSHREFPINRVIQDIKNAKAKGVACLFFTDDNIGNDKRGLQRFEALLDGIIANNLNDIKYVTQISSITASTDERLVKKMRQAGFDCVVLGMESASSQKLAYYKKGNILEHTKRAITYLKENRIIIYATLVQGTEEDREDDFKQNIQFLIDSEVDALLGQILTPYPGTQIREELLQKGLVTNPDNWDTYCGYFANIRTNYLSTEELNFLHWKYSGRFHWWRVKSFWKSALFRNHPTYFLKAVFYHRLLRYLAVRLNCLGKGEQERFKISFEWHVNLNRNLL